MPESEQIISYKRFKHLPEEELTIGMIVGPLDPSKLYTSQDWIDQTKLGIALREFSISQEPLTVPIYVHTLHYINTDHRIMVIGDRHHRTLVWAVNGKKIYGEIKATSLPAHLARTSLMPFSQFKRLYASEILGI